MGGKKIVPVSCLTHPISSTNLRFYPALKLRFYHPFKIMFLPRLKNIFMLLLPAKNFNFALNLYLHFLHRLCLFSWLNYNFATSVKLQSCRQLPDTLPLVHLIYDFIPEKNYDFVISSKLRFPIV
ncbi:hypothetical protein Hanom_Chr12g01096541 [Helianthus anomalus]